MAIGIIGAMEEETALLKERISPLSEYERAGNTFYSGKLEGVDVILLRCGIGKVNASIGTTLLISRYEPMCVINTGSAGGFSEGLKIGDIVISTQVIHHDVDVTAFGYEYGQVPSMPNAFLPHSELVDMAEKGAEKLNGPAAHKGLIATGDSFMDDSPGIAQIRERFPAIAAVEMEAASIAQTCYQFRKPFVIIRSISDIAGEESSVSFKNFLKTAAENSAELVIDIVRQLDDYTFTKEQQRAMEALDNG